MTSIRLVEHRSRAVLLAGVALGARPVASLHAPPRDNGVSAVQLLRFHNHRWLHHIYQPVMWPTECLAELKHLRSAYQQGWFVTCLSVIIVFRVPIPYPFYAPIRYQR